MFSGLQTFSPEKMAKMYRDPFIHYTIFVNLPKIARF